MSLTLKYFVLKDPINGAVTKDYGWTISRSVKNLALKLVDGKAQVKKDDTVSRTVDIRPKDASEITKEEFEKLDTSGESATSKRRREDNLIRFESHSVRFSKQKTVDTAEVAAKFEALSLVR